ncbi:hypothetical protein GCM10023191_037380 [Actinoallomurus oryzae]|uniref:Uncharacterized protein n=1 Tax=Actinoallomurus oryzae TaxID=502180 RepID=A0ABP8Q2R8_9ACTN
MNPPATMDPKRLGAIVNVFSGAFIETPEDADLVDRTRMALKTLPDKTVRELDEAIRTLALLTKERLADGRTEKQEEAR